ncbi:hypothetical protein [Pectobacterium wasabiae]|nr:hypothetical protein [Pectobacterium wasabiae]
MSQLEQSGGRRSNPPPHSKPRVNPRVSNVDGDVLNELNQSPS